MYFFFLPMNFSTVLFLCILKSKLRFVELDNDFFFLFFDFARKGLIFMNFALTIFVKTGQFFTDKIFLLRKIGLLELILIIDKTI